MLGAAFLLVTLSCGAPGTKGSADGAGDKRLAAEADFDPLGGPGDYGVVTKDVQAAETEADSGQNVEIPGPAPLAQEKGFFYSVQVFAGKSSAEAREFMDSIKPLFDQGVRMEYQAPYYKVCVGECQDIASAELLLKKVSSMGFPKAWLIRIRK
jgi:hypothetical protein